MKKRTGKSKQAGTRGAKDLAPRKTLDVKGGGRFNQAETLSSNMQKKADDTVAGQQQKIG